MARDVIGASHYTASTAKSAKQDVSNSEHGEVPKTLTFFSLAHQRSLRGEHSCGPSKTLWFGLS